MSKLFYIFRPTCVTIQLKLCTFYISSNGDEGKNNAEYKKNIYFNSNSKR